MILRALETKKTKQKRLDQEAKDLRKQMILNKRIEKYQATDKKVLEALYDQFEKLPKGLQSILSEWKGEVDSIKRVHPKKENKC